MTGPRYWLHGLLLGLTFLSTTAFGSLLADNFGQNQPFQVDGALIFFARLFDRPILFADGLSYSLTLLGILMAHELGHYFTCGYWLVDASLPYFMPAPTLTGTFGAFIRIRSPIYSKRVLFDIGVSGPIAGFVFLVPALAIGLAYSKAVPGAADQGDLTLGTPLIRWILQEILFPGVPDSDILHHPMAHAALVGAFATAVNLIPIGQLDGGHILYAFAAPYHRLMSRVFTLVLVPLSYLWLAWLFWAGVFFWIGRRHPVVYDDSSLGLVRWKLLWLAMAIFVLCFTPVPFGRFGILDWISSLTSSS